MHDIKDINHVFVGVPVILSELYFYFLQSNFSKIQ